MNPERFRALLDAYGADFERWPEAERASARALAAQDHPELRERLAEAALLDGWLDSHTVAAADDALMRRIAADAAVVASDTAADTASDSVDARRAPATRSPWWKARWVWPGAGVAGIGLAGTLAGAFAVSTALRIAAPPPAVDWPERATAFSELPADWRDE